MVKRRSGGGDDARGRRIAEVVALYESKTAAAAAAGVSTDQLARYMSGYPPPPLDIAYRLCAPHGVSLDWLGSGCGPMQPACTDSGPGEVGPPADDAAARALAARLGQAMMGEASAGLALRAGVPEAAVLGAVATGHVSAVRLSRIADALGVRLTWLASGRDDMRPADTTTQLVPEVVHRAVVATMAEIARDQLRPTPEEIAAMVVWRGLLYARGSND